MKRTVLLTGMLLLAVLILSCASNPKEIALKDFLKRHLETVIPLMRDANLAYWNAAVTGEDTLYDQYSRLDLKMRKIYSDSADYAFLKTLKNSGEIKDSLLARQMEVLLNEYLRNQIGPELLENMVTLSADIERRFSTFRGTMGGKQVTSNEIDQLLKTEPNSEARRNAWLASKQVGPLVADDLIKLVIMRNEAARRLGFDNYHTMILKTYEQNVNEINRIFDELFGLTFQPFQSLKSELDSILAVRYGIKPGSLMPWHYHDPFFQETPLVYQTDLDSYYKGQDIKELASSFYDGIGLPVWDILDRSDLYEKEGKNPHAFCTDIDREGDIRILCNIQPTERWMETMLHELGHGVYDKYQNPDVPFLLREPAHIFTTEAIAMFFGRLSRDGAWMQAMLGLTDSDREAIDQVSEKYARLKQLIFARWAMVMFKFEQALYQNPEQDLNTLWWDLKSKYQLLNKPENRDEPDWASKIHFTIAPCYYHNYLLGELLASQLHYTLKRKLHAGDEIMQYAGEKEIGVFLKKRVFEVGATLHWNAMIEQATGEPLNPEYFVNQFVY